MTDAEQPSVSRAERLAARAVSLARDAANAADDVAEHLLRLAEGDPAMLDQAAGQVERHLGYPESAAAQIATRALRRASSLAASSASRTPDPA